MFGLKLEASVRVNFVFFLNTDFNYFNMNKELSIKRGIELQIYDAGISPFVSLTTFKGQPGTMVIMSFALGVPCHLLYPYFPVSYIYGGSLSPIKS